MKFIIALLISALGLQGTWANLARYPTLARTQQQGVTDLQYAGSYFITTGTYDVDGNETPLTDSESYQIFQSDLMWRYGYSDRLELGAGIRFRYITSQFVSALNSSEDLEVTKSGLESYFLSAKYSLSREKKTSWAADVVVRQTAYTNTEYIDLSQMSADELVLGDSGLFLELGLSGDYLFNPSRLLHGRLAYSRPGNDLSEEVLYDVEHVWRDKKFDISAGVYGVYSLQSDTYESNPTSKPVQGRGPTALFNSVNRSFLSVGTGLGYLLDNWRLDGGYRRILSGTSTDQGHLFTFGLTRLGSRKKEKRTTEDQFKEYTIEAEVVKVSRRGRFIRIDRGLSSGVEQGMRFDLYDADFSGNNLLVAEAVAYKVGASSSILKVVNRFVRRRVRSGFVARAR